MLTVKREKKIENQDLVQSCRKLDSFANRHTHREREREILKVDGSKKEN